MLKKMIIASVLLAIGASQGMAQYHQYSHEPSRVSTYSDDGFENGFKKKNLFVGGGLNLGFSSYDFNAGLSPEIGYSLTRWLDAGILFNLNYSSERADPSYFYNDNVRQRSFNYGMGAFARFYPVRFLFFQIEPEYNFINYNFRYYSDPNSPPSTSTNISATTQAASFLTGIGYSQRIIGRSSFYVAIMVDLIADPNSPYRDINGAALPVVKFGFDVYLNKH